MHCWANPKWVRRKWTRWNLQNSLQAGSACSAGVRLSLGLRPVDIAQEKSLPQSLFFSHFVCIIERSWFQPSPAGFSLFHVPFVPQIIFFACLIFCNWGHSSYTVNNSETLWATFTYVPARKESRFFFNGVKTWDALEEIVIQQQPQQQPRDAPNLIWSWSSGPV